MFKVKIPHALVSVATHMCLLCRGVVVVVDGQQRLWFESNGECAGRCVCGRVRWRTHFNTRGACRAFATRLSLIVSACVRAYVCVVSTSFGCGNVCRRQFLLPHHIR